MAEPTETTPRENGLLGTAQDRPRAPQWMEHPDLYRVRFAVDLARKSIVAAPASPGPRLTLVRALAALGAYAEAEAACRDALAATGPSPELHRELIAALRNQDKVEAAPERIDSAAMSDAQSAPEQALALCDRLLAAHPADTAALRLKAMSLARLGRGEEAAACMGLDRLVHVGRLPPPTGFDAPGFHDALVREIMANPSLAPDPRGKATRGGLQTRQLRQPGATAIDALLHQIQRAIDAHIARLDAAGDTFVRGCPKRARLEAWAVVYGPEGRQNAHWHPKGWLSGVYYVAAPDRAEKAAGSGALVMGAVKPKEFAGPPPWPVWDIPPVPGRLVLFPSYVPHATRPSGLDGARISIAFDLVPVREDGPGDVRA